MNDSWRNIEVSPEDEEILVINKIEQGLGAIPENVVAIRELITRFESCHFKYQQHYKHILESIAVLEPAVAVDTIGLMHPRLEGDQWKNDSTGRSHIGHEYIVALESWINSPDSDDIDIAEQEFLDLNQITKLNLGEKNDTKIRLVRLLIARLLWAPIDELMQGGELDTLENHIIRIDICSYAFPRNLDQVIKSIGKLKPQDTFEGCGSHNDEIVEFVHKGFVELCEWMNGESPENVLALGERTPLKVWLVACLVKTLKESVGLGDIVFGNI